LGYLESASTITLNQQLLVRMSNRTLYVYTLNLDDKTEHMYILEDTT